MYDILELNDKLLADLRQIAKTLNIKRVESYKKQELIYKILDQQALVAAQSEPVVEPAAPEAAAPVEKREKKPRIRVVRPGVEKVGDSKGGVQKFARREEKKKGEVKKEEVKSEEIKNEKPLREEVKKETLKQEEPKKEERRREDFRQNQNNREEKWSGGRKEFARKPQNNPPKERANRFVHEDIIEKDLDFGDVIEMVKNGKADYGVLPIENSSAGFVNGIYDMVGNNDVTIVGEEEVHVAHALMGVPGSDLSRIKTVYSHTQGLLQCANYLSRKPWKQCSVANTAVAAVKVIEEGDKTQAAIASELAAELYGLQILAKDIVNNDNNTTRFIILSKQKIFVEKAENISIRFSLPDESGTLYNILSHINLNGINMTSIESRPLTGRKWEYAFFVTMEGSLLDSRTRHALQGICEDAMDFRLIGTY